LGFADGDAGGFGEVSENAGGFGIENAATGDDERFFLLGGLMRRLAIEVLCRNGREE